MDLKKKACLAILLALSMKRCVKRRVWMKKWLKKREKYSHVVLLKEISVSEVTDYKNYFRMNEETFDKLLQMVEPFLRRKNTVMRNSLPVKERLALTFRYLATGRSFEDMKFSVVMSPASISTAILETCEVLIYVLQDYIKFPATAQEWINIANDFGSRCQFWNCVGSIDGKHIAITKPANSGSLYYNYKGFFSIVLLAVVNAKREFIMVDVGTNGRVSDGGVMFYSKFGELLQQNALNLPEDTPLPNTPEKFPYVFVADEAFALDRHLLKPYSQKNLNNARQEFNKRLSRSRVVVENAFGILASRFGIFQKAINLAPEKASTITAVCCYLHNFLAKETKQYFQFSEVNTSENNLVDLQCTLRRNSTLNAKDIREKFCLYYNNEGKLQ